MAVNPLPRRACQKRAIAGPLPVALITGSSVCCSRAIRTRRRATDSTAPGSPLPSQDLYDKSLVYAKLASLTYNATDWNLAEFGIWSFSGIDDVLAQDFATPGYERVARGGNRRDWAPWTWDSGLDYSVFQNQTTKDIVLAFRGTEPLSWVDWAQNASQLAGWSSQYAAAVELATCMAADVDSKNKKENTDVKLSFTGHSLGGGLATAAALATGREAIAFDAAGISDVTMRDRGLTTSHERMVTNFNVRECFVSDWNERMDRLTVGTVPALGIICRQYGSIYWLESVSDRAEIKASALGIGAAVVQRFKLKKILNHAWHVFTYQLQHRNFA